MPPPEAQRAGPRREPAGGAGGRRPATPGRRREITAAHYLGGTAHRPARRQARVSWQHGCRAAPPDSGDPLQVAPRGWVDLRPEHFGIWITRAVEMVRQADARAAGPQGSGSDMDWNAIEPDEPIESSRFATWVFTVEDKGTRIKR